MGESGAIPLKNVCNAAAFRLGGISMASFPKRVRESIADAVNLGGMVSDDLFGIRGCKSTFHDILPAILLGSRG